MSPGWTAEDLQGTWGGVVSGAFSWLIGVCPAPSVLKALKEVLAVTEPAPEAFFQSVFETIRRT